MGLVVIRTKQGLSLGCFLLPALAAATAMAFPGEKADTAKASTVAARANDPVLMNAMETELTRAMNSLGMLIPSMLQRFTLIF